ncbi:hypothetical protein [Streptomyces brevispora]|uniref:hypothetical protein n=1 Tax=Streptomyces brevispora TaxID=887462 RepID=UPI0039A75508
MELEDPSRDRSPLGRSDYTRGVNDWRTRRADIFEDAMRERMTAEETGAFLVWGDPTLYGPALRGVYTEAFREPPRREGEESATAFLGGGLADDVRRPGFTAAIALRGADVVGFTHRVDHPREPFPADRRHPPAAAELGAENARS